MPIIWCVKIVYCKYRLNTQVVTIHCVLQIQSLHIYSVYYKYGFYMCTVCTVNTAHLAFGYFTCLCFFRSLSGYHGWPAVGGAERQKTVPQCTGWWWKSPTLQPFPTWATPSGATAARGSAVAEEWDASPVTSSRWGGRPCSTKTRQRIVPISTPPSSLLLIPVQTGRGPGNEARQSYVGLKCLIELQCHNSLVYTRPLTWFV